MRRYLSFEGLTVKEQTASAMRAARFALCEKLFAAQPPPTAGVLDTWSLTALEPLITQSWHDIPKAPSDFTRRHAAKRAVLETLQDDVDCLSPCEHELIERILAEGGTSVIISAEDFDASLAMRNKLWCDMGGIDGRPAVRLDPALEQPIRDALARFDHLAIRSRVFTFDAMIHAMLYAAGFLDDALPRARFVGDVLMRKESNATARLARNFVESAYDCVLYADCRLLLHEALALPESFVEQLATRGSNVPPMTPERMLGCMNGLLPEEKQAVNVLKRALQYALRPGIALDEAADDLKLLTKQGVSFEGLQQVASDMLCVMPTPAIDCALQGLINTTPRWL